jgi:hypothetical protein
VNVLYPKFPLRNLPAMLRIALAGAALAGCYGALHDQISYSISPEYFEKLKFHQFSYANFGWPRRVFASEVGFLASFWVGLAGGWFIARAAVAAAQPISRNQIVKSFAIVAAITLLGGAMGALAGVIASRAGDLSGWEHWQRDLDIRQIRPFVVVAYLHAGSYIGALAGIIAAVVLVRRHP